MFWTLSKRLVACKHWRWIPGMRAIAEDGSHLRLVYKFNDAMWFEEEAEEMLACKPVNPLPDLIDSATLGCILQLVWEAWFEAIYMEPQVDGGWLAIRPDGAVLHLAPATYAETLVIALEAAP